MICQVLGKLGDVIKGQTNKQTNKHPASHPYFIIILGLSARL